MVVALAFGFSIGFLRAFETNSNIDLNRHQCTQTKQGTICESYLRNSKSYLFCCRLGRLSGEP